MRQPSVNCRITLRGSYDLDWTEYVGDMLLDVRVEEGSICSTTLIGHPIDLAAFLGTLHMLIDRGFAVIAFDYQQVAGPTSVAGATA